MQPFKKAEVVIAVINGAVEQGFRIGEDGRQRGAQFVREVGEEFAAHTLQSLKLSDVEEDADNQPATQGGDVQLITARLDIGHLDARLDRLMFLKRLAERLVDQRVARRINQAKLRGGNAGG